MAVNKRIPELETRSAATSGMKLAAYDPNTDTTVALLVSAINPEAAEDSFAYDPNTTYAADDVAVYLDQIYVSLQANNQDNPPDEVGSLFWAIGVRGVSGLVPWAASIFTAEHVTVLREPSPGVWDLYYLDDPTRPYNSSNFATELAAGDWVRVGVSGGGGGGTAASITFSPAGNITATQVQAAIEELDTEKASISYVDSKVAGLKWKDSVIVATTVAGTLATSFENGDTIDGVVIATGNRVLIKDQATQSENGIYIINASGAPTRSSDANSSAALEGATVPVQQGTSNANTSWVQTSDGITLDSSNLVFSQIGSSVPDAGETVKGIIEIATQAETDAGVDNTRALTPAKAAARYATLTAATKRIALVCTDLTTGLTVGNTKAFYDFDAAFTITSVRAIILTPQTSGTILTIDINEAGTTILSTKLTIDNNETSSSTAATPAVISDAAIAAGSRVTVDFDSVGVGGAGVTVEIKGNYN